MSVCVTAVSTLIPWRAQYIFQQFREKEGMVEVEEDIAPPEAKPRH